MLFDQYATANTSGTAPQGIRVQSYRRAPTHASLAPNAKPLKKAKKSARRESTPFLLLIAFLCYGSVALAVVGWYSFGNATLRSTVGSAVESLNFGRHSSKEILLRHVNALHARENGAQVRYVSNLILRSKGMPEREAHALAVAIVLESQAAELDPLFVAAVIKTESTFKKHAVSHSGATGLMQIKADTGRYISERASLDWDGLNSLNDPIANVKLGIAYLKQLKTRFRGNVENALIAYNWGPTNLFHALKERSTIPESTKHYAKSILVDQKKWQHEYAQRAAQLRYQNAGDAIG